MRVAIVHNPVSSQSRADESDVLIQVEEVRSALDELGHSYEIMAVDRTALAWLNRLRDSPPDVVFNLVESLEGSDQGVSAVLALIEGLGIPLTGSSSESLWLTNHKLLAKDRFKLLGLPTPAWLGPYVPPDAGVCLETLGRLDPGSRFILKPVGEHASVGMDESAMVQPHDVADLAALILKHSEKLGMECFAEQFISGREFNVSLLASAEGCQVLPVAEIDFSAFPSEKLRIVDYRAKWDSNSFEFQHTPRRFLRDNEERELSSQLCQLALDCWAGFQLGGHVRVDFRVDEQGQPWILEVNTNPCLSPDAGFAAALQQARIGFSEAIQRILADDVRKRNPAVMLSTACQEALQMIRGKPATEESDSRAHPQGSDWSLVQPPNSKPNHGPCGQALTWRYEVSPGDPEAIRDLVAKTGFFYPDEVAIAEELVQERLAKGPASGYHFVFAEVDGVVAGYACYGHIACTRNSYDLYWIAIDPSFQGQGIGRLVLAEAERCIRQAGGQRVYIETSNREQYRSTRGFYLRCGYECAATLTEFYGPGDDKVIYVKAVGSVASHSGEVGR